MAGFFEKAKEVMYAAIGKRPFVSAVIVAGGSGSRMGTDKTKQMLVLASKPLVVHTLLAFEKSECINEIVVVAKEDECAEYDNFKKEYGITKLTKTVVGGATRQQSAKNGFDAISEKADFVAIHDAARALITPTQIKEVVMSAVAHGAAIAATPSTDTIKYAEGQIISETIPREKIWLTQTPQVFRDEIYRVAAYTAEKEGFVATDDSSLVENIGINVYLVDTGADNFKVTYSTDISRAEDLLLKREANNKCE